MGSEILDSWRSVRQVIGIMMCVFFVFVNLVSGS